MENRTKVIGISFNEWKDRNIEDKGPDFYAAVMTEKTIWILFLQANNPKYKVVN